VTHLGNPSAPRSSAAPPHLPEGVRSTGAHAFRELGKLRSVRMPRTLKMIYDGAFCGCTSLKTLQLWIAPEYVGRCAFADYASVEVVQLGDGSGTVRELAFDYSCSLQYVS